MNKDKTIFYISAGLVLGLSLYGAARSIATMIGWTGASPLKSVVIIPAPVVASRDMIIEKLNITAGAPIYEINTQDAAANVETLPEISQAQVKRSPNGTLYVAISEMVPVAVWTDGTNIYPITANGIKIDKALNEKPANAVMFSGNPVRDTGSALKVLNKFPDILAKTQQVQNVEDRRFNLLTQAGAKIMLGEDLEKSLETLRGLDIMNRRAKTIDLRDPARTLVRP